MVSEFRKKKLLHIFNNFFDTDRNGAVDKNDFELVLEKLAKLRGWKEGEYIYEEGKKMAVTMWEGLQKEADKDNSGQVTATEWLQLWEEYTKNPDAAKEWQALYCMFIFQLQDASRNGKIDSQEFAGVYEAFGLKKEESVVAFKKLSSGKEEVSWAEFQTLWAEFFASEDEAAPGNYIFGSF